MIFLIGGVTRYISILVIYANLGTRSVQKVMRMAPSLDGTKGEDKGQEFHKTQYAVSVSNSYKVSKITECIFDVILTPH